MAQALAKEQRLRRSFSEGAKENDKLTCYKEHKGEAG